MTDKTIKLNNGQTLPVPDDFIVLDANLVKINLTDTNGMNEGIWAWISTKDKQERYDKPFSDDQFYVALLANQSLAGIPWGCYIPIKYVGNSRPISKKEWLDLTAAPCMEMSLFDE